MLPSDRVAASGQWLCKQGSPVRSRSAPFLKSKSGARSPHLPRFFMPGSIALDKYDNCDKGGIPQNRQTARRGNEIEAD
jgi:hypothetical protein